MKPQYYHCSNCEKEIRLKAVSELLTILRLCPQCYTKKVVPGNKK